MPGIFVVVFWLWTAASVLILLRRLITTKSLRGSSDATAIEAEESPQDRVAAFEAKLAAQSPSADRAPGDPPPAPDQPVRTDIPPEPEMLAPDPGGDRQPRAETLAEALTGIEMPSDLSPLIGQRVDPRWMLFATESARPAAVGEALADELERLGFSLQSLDERSIAAQRPGVAVEVRILPTAESARAALGDRLETISDNAVIAEFQLR